MGALLGVGLGVPDCASCGSLQTKSGATEPEGVVPRQVGEGVVGDRAQVLSHVLRLFRGGHQALLHLEKGDDEANDFQRELEEKYRHYDGEFTELDTVKLRILGVSQKDGKIANRRKKA